jgi:hypothetical protein
MMLSGWTDICEHTHRSRNTLKKMIQDEGFPIKILFNKPTTTEHAIEKWFEKRLKIKESVYLGLSQSQIRARLLVL